jgi:hypothetical protein
MARNGLAYGMFERRRENIFLQVCARLVPPKRTNIHFEESSVGTGKAENT